MSDADLIKHRTFAAAESWSDIKSRPVRLRNSPLADILLWGITMSMAKSKNRWDMFNSYVWWLSDFWHILTHILIPVLLCPGHLAAISSNVSLRFSDSVFPWLGSPRNGDVLCIVPHHFVRMMIKVEVSVYHVSKKKNTHSCIPEIQNLCCTQNHCWTTDHRFIINVSIQRGSASYFLMRSLNWTVLHWFFHVAS